MEAATAWRCFEQLRIGWECTVCATLSWVLWHLLPANFPNKFSCSSLNIFFGITGFPALQKARQLRYNSRASSFHCSFPLQRHGEKSLCLTASEDDSILPMSWSVPALQCHFSNFPIIHRDSEHFPAICCTEYLKYSDYKVIIFCWLTNCALFLYHGTLTESGNSIWASLVYCINQNGARVKEGIPHKNTRLQWEHWVFSWWYMAQTLWLFCSCAINFLLTCPLLSFLILWLTDFT